MCRIAGIIDKGKSYQQLQMVVKAMCDVMAHGGPDDEGFFIEQEKGLAFGHRRLAVIDLSPAGHQPMFYDGNQLTITFNGEIYNYAELKTELIEQGFEFRSDCDTEVILAAYRAWGTDSFSRLRGMFAFAIYDKHLSKSFLVRDPSGIKPLYYSLDGTKLLFASEVKAFKKINPHLQENLNWKIYFLAFGHIPEPYTTYENVEMLAKRHFLQWDHVAQTAQIHPYQEKKITERITRKEVALRRIDQSLNRAVKRHLIADAPIGVFLSGGIDSSLITLLANKALKEQPGGLPALKTLSINFKENQFSEKAYQQIIVAQVKGQHHEFLIDENTFSQHLPTALNAMDQPSMDGINSWFVNYFAKQNGLRAVLSGIGADELFGGYQSFKRMHVIRWLAKLPKLILKQTKYLNRPALKRFYYLSYKHSIGNYLFLRGVYAPHEIAALLRISIKEVDKALLSIKSPTPPKKLTPEEEAGWLETNFYMQNQLLKDTDSMSMQHGVEVRIPFLDQDFTQLADALQADIRYQKQQPKGLLIDTFKAILPKAIWNRKKMGFTFPFQIWLRNNDFFLKGLENESGKAQKLKADFINGQLHWSKAMVMYQLKNFGQTRSL